MEMNVMLTPIVLTPLVHWRPRIVKESRRWRDGDPNQAANDSILRSAA